MQTYLTLLLYIVILSNSVGALREGGGWLYTYHNFDITINFLIFTSFLHAPKKVKGNGGGGGLREKVLRSYLPD